MVDPRNVNQSFASTLNGDDIISQRSEVNTFTGPATKIRDIEEADYIYKVKCDPRETISLRDSKPVTYTDGYKEVNGGKSIQLTDIRSTDYSLKKGINHDDGMENTGKLNLVNSMKNLSDQKKQTTEKDDSLKRRSTYTKKNLAIDIPRDEFQASKA